MRILGLSIVIAAMFIFSVPVTAQVTYSFANITNNSTSDASVQPNGVNNGESLRIEFNPQSGSAYDDVLSSLDNDSLRTAIHLRGFGKYDSKSFVTGGADGAVPAPGAVLLASIGMACVGWFRRRGYF